MNKKLFYTQPTTDLLELESEGIVCASLNSVMLLEEATNDDWGTL